MSSLSPELLFAVQIGLDLLLIGLFVYMIKQVRRPSQRGVAGNTVEMTSAVTSVLEEAKAVAAQFDRQLKEKREIIGRLSEQLDNRIINLNLLLKQSDPGRGGAEEAEGPQKGQRPNSYDLQQEILSLSEKGLPATEIAETLGIVQGEVNLVLDLKKKFREMEVH